MGGRRCHARCGSVLCLLGSFAFGTYYLAEAGVERLRERATALVLASVTASALWPRFES
jgi:hypothetical protein